MHSGSPQHNLMEKGQYTTYTLRWKAYFSAVTDVTVLGNQNPQGTRKPALRVWVLVWVLQHWPAPIPEQYPDPCFCLAAAATAKEATWLKVLFFEIEPSLMHTAIKLFIDNQSAMSHEECHFPWSDEAHCNSSPLYQGKGRWGRNSSGVPADCRTGRQRTYKTSQLRETHSFYRR